MVLVQDGDGMLDSKVFLAPDTPWDLGEPIEIVSGNVEFRSGRFQVGQFVDFIVEHFPYGFGHGELIGLLLELLDELVFAVRFDAELPPDAFHLLHEPVFPLAFRNLALDVLGDLGL